MAESITADTVFWSLVSGIIPPLIWLWFWLREDKNPEPRHLILTTFLLGMFSVYPAYRIEQFLLTSGGYDYSFIILWPLTEEITKYLAAYVVALRSKEYNEPIDAVIYLITAALGFAAAENFFFLIKPDFSMISLITANMRFVGATLLHLLSSATIGVFMALNFYKNETTKRVGLIFGLFTATVLHSLFNLFIIKDSGSNILTVFFILWSLIIILMLFLEKIKNIKQS